MAKITTDRLKHNPPLGTMPVLQYALPAQLQIDPGYQRSIEGQESQVLIRKIAAHWNWDLCLPLVVSRRTDGSLFVIDGQHRLAAARLRGDIAQLPCVIGSYGSAADEAATFVKVNQERRKLGALDLFRAALASGDNESIDIYRAMEAARLSLAPHINHSTWKPGQICQVGSVRAAWHKWGEDATSAALGVMAEAFAGKVLCYAGTLFPGIAKACADEVKRGGISHEWHEAFVVRLGRDDQAWWRTQILIARGINPLLTPTTAAEFVICRAAQGRSDILPDGELVESVAATVNLSASKTGMQQEGSGRPSIGRQAALIRASIEGQWDDSGRAWCDQCEMRVTRDQAEGCKSKFCKVRPNAAAQVAA